MELISDHTDPAFNCYVSHADAIVFIGNMVRAPNWKAAGDTEQQRALITATNLIDQYSTFYGFVVDVEQPLAWPRSEVQRMDRELGIYYPADAIPDIIQYAVVLYAEALLGEDLTADQETGLSALRVGPISLNFNKIDRKDVMPENVKLLLNDFAKVRTGKNSVVPVVRR